MGSILFIPRKRNVLPPFDLVKYGLLYNWYSLIDSRNIVSSDEFRLSIHTDWTTLISYLGGAANGGGKCKEIGLTYWLTPNTGATNISLMNIRGAGYRATTGAFSSIKSRGFIWSSLSSPTSVYMENFRYDRGSYSSSGEPFECGFSVRLIKVATLLTNGQEGRYYGNDGKIYRTICVGNQEYLADNLAETKYRNGDTIPEVTNNAAWAALTTGALCAYNNDWNNVLI